MGRGKEELRSLGIGKAIGGVKRSTCWRWVNRSVEQERAKL